ncbi:hypothetical protein OLX02_05675 [Novosphingobium sp. KCTC 2891]|nr:hypothetical protein [Novosphingobium sp. KCTC 2891]
MALTVAIPAQAEPGAMSIAAFLAKAEALRAKGPFALMSGDYKLLKEEVTGAAQVYRARLRGEQAAGRPSSCPPARAPFGSDDVMAQMRSYPVAQRGQLTVGTAVADLFRARYPCGTK